jgi:integrase/recombinase XerD
MDGISLVSLKPQDLKWEMAIRLFSLRCKSQNLSPRTQQLYTEKLGAFRSWVADNSAPTPSETRPDHLRAFLEARKARGVSDQTVDGFYRVLRTFWRFLHSDGLILLDPMVKVERPRRERRHAKPITGAQLQLILAQIDIKDSLGLRDYAMILLLADSGLRLSEALSLKLSDVDWANNSAVVMGKGRKERRVAFGQTARRALLTWARRRGGIEGAELLFVNRYGQALSPCTFDQRMKGYTRDAGIAAKRLSPHALRHFFALSFLKNGGDVMALQKLLGHASLDMVRNYVNMTDDDALSKHRQASPLDRMGPLPNERKKVRLR